MKLNLLVAYPYFTDKIIQRLQKLGHENYRLIVDSGCFTAWHTGKEITLDGYMNFLKKVECLKPYHAVQLDVFGNPEQTFVNYQKMLEKGYSDIMPVFTREDSLEKLEYFYSKTDYIMFGGIVIGGKNKEYVKWFLEKNKGRDCHWLGFVKPEWIRVFKPYSCDSSSWASASRFGGMGIYVGNGEIKVLKKTDFAKRPKQEYIDALLGVGLRFEEIKKLAKADAWRSITVDGKALKGFSQFCTTLAHLKRMYDVRKKYGTRIFLAIPNEQYLEHLINADRFLKERGVVNV